MSLEDMFVYDNMEDDVYEAGLLKEVMDEFEEQNIKLDDIISNKRRITMKSFHVLNELLSQWHLEKRYSIVDVIVALSNYSYTINDIMLLLNSENVLFVRETLAAKYGKKIVSVTDSSEFFE